ncbi:putative immunity protein [Alienimonas californiensis]|uniref:Imm-5-like domain-containing protein n=1 Tax=Alienimonas californiensis TaxID=2527989 RepID=A0A517P4N2_9PLAN|nr:hypothetical protein [Alienimonas californiensis]QDT14330.1 hypothetical protein CA12_04020 [Alienimonas californiensis]
MRDRRFIAAHRGGPLSRTDHHRLALWATDCAERVLPLFEDGRDDDRPRRAIEAARLWAGGGVRVGVGQRAAWAAHAAAREAVGDPAAVAAARAAGHAAATAHMADHSLGPVLYGLRAIAAAGGDVDAEQRRQLERLPEDLRELATSAIAARPGWRAPTGPSAPM